MSKKEIGVARSAPCAGEPAGILFFNAFVLHVAQDEKLVVVMNERLSLAAAQRIRVQLTEFLGDKRFLLINGDVDLAKVSA